MVALGAKRRPQRSNEVLAAATADWSVFVCVVGWLVGRLGLGGRSLVAQLLQVGADCRGKVL